MGLFKGFKMAASAAVIVVSGVASNPAPANADGLNDLINGLNDAANAVQALQNLESALNGNGGRNTLGGGNLRNAFEIHPNSACPFGYLKSHSTNAGRYVDDKGRNLGIYTCQRN